MTPNLEMFRPKLRPGRVIPTGSRIIFEMHEPYNQIELPMVLADFILLCSGHFTVREILEKIYRKQGSVPFRSILKAIHLLHQGGFFENGNELILSQNLQSWMRPRRNSWRFSWRFGKKIMAANASPNGFYLLSLFSLIVSIFGLQYIPIHPLTLVEAWGSRLSSPSEALWEVLIWGSLLQTVRYALCGVQLLLLTSKVYNVSLRLSPWGVHLHVGDEANDLFENRLFTAMFHVSQIICSWLVVAFAAQSSWVSRLEPLVILAAIHSFWEINPFRHSEGKKLFRDLILPQGQDVSAWHFDRQAVVRSLSVEEMQRDQVYSRLASSWGFVWLIGAFVGLTRLGFVAGPEVLSALVEIKADSVIHLLALSAWLLALYYIAQSLVRVLMVAIVRPGWANAKAFFRSLWSRNLRNWSEERLKKSLEELPLFSHFEEEHLEKIVKQSKLESFESDVVIFDQGDASHDLYILLDGEVGVFQKNDLGGEYEKIFILKPGSIFGESALVDATPRAARVCASGFVAVLKIPIAVIRQGALESRSVRQLEVFRNAIMLNQYFVSSPAFRSLTVGAVHFLCSRGAFESFDAGQVVFNQGDEGDSLYLILRGHVQVLVHKNPVKTIQQGGFFGEIALIADIPRTATVVTVQPSILFRITTDAFWEVLVENMDLGIFIETLSENRLREDLMMVFPSKTGTDY